MKLSKLICCAIFAYSSVLPNFSFGAPVGPDVTHTEVNASVSYNLSTLTYTYTYDVTSLSGNTGDISSVDIDITTNLTNLAGFPDPAPQTPEVKEFITQEFQDKGINVLPVEIIAPAGWGVFPITMQGSAAWVDISEAAGLAPGQTVNGLTLTSEFVPGIRSIRISPETYSWNLLPSVDDTEEFQAQRHAFIESLDYITPTLGPFGIQNNYSHWNHVRDSLNRVISLGWVSESTLADALVTQLANARDALDVQDGTLAKERLQLLITTVTQSDSSQRRNEVRDLLILNIQKLIEDTPDTPIPFEPKLTLTPNRAELPIGTKHSITATLVNIAYNNEAIVGEAIPFFIVDGPHFGLREVVYTDQNGMATYSYVGKRIGTDTVVVREQELDKYTPKLETMVASVGDISTLMIPPVAFLDLRKLRAEARVTWTGGPDLIVPHFIPPFIKSEGGKTIFISDITQNIGNTTATPSSTRYYLSSMPPPFSLYSAEIIGERSVPALAPGEISEVDSQTYTLPAGFPAGTYNMAACADAREEIIENDEQNNCSYIPLEMGVRSIIVPMEAANEPPNCTVVEPSISLLWPPNHKLSNVAILGVTDPDGDPITIQVNTITQDEPVNAQGDGSTNPDGVIISEAQVRLRSERSGQGNGRVYNIGFTAEDDKGGSCTGIVSVGVPHDQGKGSMPIDDGQSYDSTESF